MCDSWDENDGVVVGCGGLLWFLKGIGGLALCRKFIGRGLRDWREKNRRKNKFWARKLFG